MCYTRVASVSFANFSSNMPPGFYQIASDPESEGTINNSSGGQRGPGQTGAGACVDSMTD
jgi:hypothetical protein